MGIVIGVVLGVIFIEVSKRFIPKGMSLSKPDLSAPERQTTC